MPLAKPIRPSADARHQRRRVRPNAKDRTVKIECGIFHSTAIICEFLYYAFNTILSLRSIYPEQDFRWERRYEIFLPLLVDTVLKGYLTTVTTQLKPWLESGSLSRVVLAIVSKQTRETIERWQFDIQSTETTADSSLEFHQSHRPSHDPHAGPKEDHRPDLPKATEPHQPILRSDRDMQAEALQIFRQIFSSVTFLPAMEADQCLFTILSYVNRSEPIPNGWNQSDPHIISATADQVPIHGLTTSVHKLKPTVTYCQPPTELEQEE